jgi:Skp family chaperone for outer membrane proteins
MARTAAVAGTAAVTVGAIQGRQQRKAAAAQQEAAEDAAVAQSQQDIAAMQAQMQAMQAQQANAAVQQAAAPAGGSDMMAQLQQLAQLHESGVLTDEEFAAAKAKLLAGG